MMCQVRIADSCNKPHRPPTVTAFWLPLLHFVASTHGLAASTPFPFLGPESPCRIVCCHVVSSSRVRG